MRLIKIKVVGRNGPRRTNNNKKKKYENDAC